MFPGFAKRLQKNIQGRKNLHFSIKNIFNNPLDKNITKFPQNA